METHSFTVFTGRCGGWNDGRGQHRSCGRGYSRRRRSHRYRSRRRRAGRDRSCVRRRAHAGAGRRVSGAVGGRAAASVSTPPRRSAHFVRCRASQLAGAGSMAGPTLLRRRKIVVVAAAAAAAAPSSTSGTRHRFLRRDLIDAFLHFF